ncbi:MAG: hypothetical protein K6F66_00600 [Pseudobutyrivibrio sp.]|nr:hypothetical protein [Pseudobutyrivibrio sp.]
MQGEYRGKPIFSHRYIGMDEDSIRAEIDRLQGELYSMEEALDFYSRDNRQIQEDISANQVKNEKLLRSMELKIQDLQDKLDYGTPVKTQLANVTKEFTEKLDEVYNADRLKNHEKSISTLIGISIANTILILILIGLVCYSILVI